MIKIITNLILLTILMSCNGKTQSTSTTTNTTNTNTPVEKCTDVNASNQNSSLPCVCNSGYELSYDKKICYQSSANNSNYIPKNFFYSVNPLNLYVDQGIVSPITPSIDNCTTQTVNGITESTPCSFVALTALPQGLILNPSTGAITGSPSLAKAQSSYTIKAINKYGFTTISLFIKVSYRNPAGLSLSYNNPTYLLNSAISQNVINYTSGYGSIQSMSISPALPTGLSLQTVGDKQWGIIGLPTIASPLTQYTITALGADGVTTASFNFTLAVSSPPTSLTYPSNSNCGDSNGYYTCTFTFGQSFSDIIPTYNGANVSFRIAQDSLNSLLPSGINLSAISGKIQTTSYGPFETTDYLCSGAEYCIYKIEAFNELGSISKLIRIKVLSSPPPSSFNYLSSSYSFRTLEVISDIIPQFPNGLPNCYGSSNCFTVSPALPNGLSFSDSTGKIVGSPNKNSKQISTTYTIVAHDSRVQNGISANISIEIKERLPVFSYNQQGIYSLKKNSTISEVGSGISPTAVGYEQSSCGPNAIPIASFSISPALPAGLVLNTNAFDCANPILSGGSITGMPTVYSPETTYTITGCNDGGCSSATIKISVTPEIVELAGGLSHACAIVRETYNATSDQLMCWGNNTNGQLGYNTTLSYSNRAKFSTTTENVLGVATGKEHTCFIEKQTYSSDVYQMPPFTGENNITVESRGNVKCFGLNDFSQLGRGTTGGNFSNKLNVIKNDNSTLDEVVQISSGYDDTCAISYAIHDYSGTLVKVPGAVYCWGKNYGNKAVRIGSITNDPSTEFYATQIKVGENHACAIRQLYANDYTQNQTDVVYCWGKNDKGQLGNGLTDSNFSLTPVASIDYNDLPVDTVTSLSLGSNHTCAYNQSGDINYNLPTGKIRCWGDNSSGQVKGNSITQIYTKGQEILGNQGIGILEYPFKISSGKNYTMINTNDGVDSLLKFIGQYNIPNSQYTGTSTQYPVNILMNYASGINPFYTNGIIMGGASMDSYSCSVQSNDFNIYCWGKNDKGQLGSKDLLDKTYPNKLQFEF